PTGRAPPRPSTPPTSASWSTTPTRPRHSTKPPGPSTRPGPRADRGADMTTTTAQPGAQTAAPPTGALSAARRRARRRALLMRYALIAPAARCVLAFFGCPIVKNLVMSFQAYDCTTFFNGEAPFVGLANYRA